VCVCVRVVVAAVLFFPCGVGLRGWRAAQAHTPSSDSSFAVRGDGVTTLVVAAADATAVSVSATAAGFTQTVVAVSTAKAAAADFKLFTVRVGQGGRGWWCTTAYGCDIVSVQLESDGREGMQWCVAGPRLCVRL
jgi:hypothetical protein